VEIMPYCSNCDDFGGGFLEVSGDASTIHIDVTLVFRSGLILSILLGLQNVKSERSSPSSDLEHPPLLYAQSSYPNNKTSC
jgi:hypothetical protein